TTLFTLSAQFCTQEPSVQLQPEAPLVGWGWFSRSSTSRVISSMIRSIAAWFCIVFEFTSLQVCEFASGFDSQTRVLANSLLCKPLLNRHDFVHAAGVAIAAEVGGQPGLHNLLGQIGADEPGAQGEDVGVVVFPAVNGRCLVITHRRTYAGDFVGRHAAANTCPVDDNAAPGAPGGDELRHRISEVWVVYRIHAVCATIHH